MKFELRGTLSPPQAQYWCGLAADSTDLPPNKSPNETAPVLASCNTEKLYRRCPRSASVGITTRL